MIPLPRLPAYYLRADNMPDEYTQTACRVQKRYSYWILHEALLLLGTRFFSHRNLYWENKTRPFIIYDDTFPS